MIGTKVAANGIEIAYAEAGSGERPLVLVHGYTGFRQDFESQWQGLAELGWTLAPDLRGHGESSHADPAGYTLDTLAADLIAFLDALGIGRCDLLGHSMGGMAVLRAALAAPERVASLVLMNTSASPLDFIDPDLMERASQLACAAGMDALFEAMRAHESDDRRTAPSLRTEVEWGAERFWRWRRARIVAMDPRAYLPFAAQMRGCASVEPRLGEIACPTTVLVGDRDAEFLAPSAALAASIPDARQVVLAHAAHQPQHEAPEAWLAAIAEHLRRVR